MPSRGQTITVTYTAWDTVANGPKTGDVANHTLRWVKDGTSAAPTNAASEVDATNAKGEYELTLTGTECTCNFGTLCGVSSTSGIVIIPVKIAFEQLPTATPAASGGLPTVGTGAGQITPDGTTGGVNTTKWGGTAVGSIPPDVVFVRGGTAQAGSTTTITLDAGASSVDGFYNGQTVLIRSGTGAGQSATIKSYVGSTKVATLNQTLGTAIDNTSVFTLIAAGVPVATVTGTVALSAPDTNVFASGTAAAGSSTTITLASALGTDSLPVGAKIKITSGTGTDQCRVVTGYVNSTKVVTVDRAFTVTPDNTSVYALMYDDAPALNSSLQVAASSDTSYSCGFEAALTDSAGDAVRIETWLKDQSGKQIDQAAGATCTITFRELGSHVDLLSLTPALDTTNHRFYVEQATPDFATDRGYVILVTITDASSNVYGPTIHSTSVFG